MSFISTTYSADDDELQRALQRAVQRGTRDTNKRHTFAVFLRATNIPQKYCFFSVRVVQ
jgi:hypothetical protein